jgi:hypothetical protein
LYKKRSIGDEPNFPGFNPQEHYILINKGGKELENRSALIDSLKRTKTAKQLNKPDKPDNCSKIALIASLKLPKAAE